MKSLLTTVCLIWLSCFAALGQNVELAALTLSKSEVLLAWSIPAGKTYASFRIDRQTTGSWLIINTVQGTVKSYTNVGLTEKTKYRYRLFCKGTGSTADYTTNEVEVTTLPATLVAPDIKSVDPIWDGNSEQISGINVKWDTKSSEHTGFVIECLINGVSQGRNDLGFGKDLTEHTIKKTPTQTWPGCGAKIEVKLKAVIDGGGLGASMSSLEAVSSKSPTVRVPEVPQGVKAGYMSERLTSATWIRVSWEGAKKPESVESGFVVQHATKSDFSDAKEFSVPMNTESIDFTGGLASTGLANSTTYYFRVAAKNCNVAKSDWSNPTSAITPSGPPPKAPTITKTLSRNWTKNSDKITEITFEWTDNSDDETEFDVQWGTNNQYTNGGTNSVGKNSTRFKAEGNWEGCGTRFYVRVRARKGDAVSAWSEHNEIAEITVPDKPASLIATTKSSTEVELKWGGANETYSREGGFVITYTSPGQSPKEAGVAGMNTESYVVTGLQPSTDYIFAVKARNCKGDSEGITAPAKTSDTPATPTVPTDLLAVTTSETSIELSWTYKTLPGIIVIFEVQRSEDGSNFTPLPIGTGSSTADASGKVSGKRSDTSLKPGTTYHYKVRAKSPSESGFSEIAKATTSPAPIPKPAAPTNLAAAAPSSSQINLSWTDASNNEDAFDIERSTDNANWGNLESVGPNVVTYGATGLNANTKYYFHVRAKNKSGTSDWSNVAEATTQAPPVTITKPSAPANLVASSASSSQVNLTWTDASSNEEGFELERSTDNVTWANLISVGANAVLFSATSLVANTKYYFRIRARNSGGVSDWSNVAEATTQSLVAAKPATPTNLRLKATTANQISIEWEDRATDETSYEVSRSADSTGKWEIIKSDLPVNTKEFADKPVRSGRKYFYRIRAVRNSDFSDYSTVLETIAPIVNAVDDDPITWQVYPNPVAETVQIQLNSSAMCAVVIRNVVGDELLKTSLRTSGSILVSELPSGVYFLQITTSSQSKVFRILKQ
jgi:hypothetical protein